MEFSLHPLGDNAVIIELGEDINIETQQKVQFIASLLDKNTEDWMIEYIPAFTTVTLFYDPVKVSTKAKKHTLPYDFVCSRLRSLLAEVTTGNQANQRVVQIPVCYGGELGPDLEFVAGHNGLTTEEVIHIHSTGDYIVYMIGFAPGFPYIGGMSEKIATPRRKTPRIKIPPRTVGIAGKQTGVYPIETPGGWQLIGRTPVELFRPDEEPPSLLRAGDRIQFKPISYEEYLELGGDK
ncbi:kinase inhibitor [Bacillus sp. V3-13]|uniref:5-oxoprolinase subunit PxpB n=1 Tax=Bacillus sp. V3-13 TaxID=2053728 RepID=UPI000C77DC93|nr:5-oxoprolinase subunit PxpB [Bacillus sp. V3-13]PLR75586.1 kinase inhibitor [Bacillus sp. V3-13]